MNNLRDKIIGMFLGVAIGDALGMPVETFTFNRIEKDYGRIMTYLPPPATHKWYGGKLEAGMWTDDTQLTLAIAKSLTEKGDIDFDDIAAKHVLAMNDTTIGWGRSTLESVKRIESGVHWSKSGNPGGAGNGVAMKIAPIGAYMVTLIDEIYRNHSERREFSQMLNMCHGYVFDKINIIAKMTHNSALGCVSGVKWSFLIFGCLHQWSEESFLKNIQLKRREEVADSGYNEMAGKLEYISNNLQELRSLSSEKLAQRFGDASCYVVNSLPFSFACFIRNPRSIEALYDAVNAGGDTDSNASMVGGLLGAFNGADIFPQHLIDGLWRKDEILQVANDFCDKFEIR